MTDSTEVYNFTVATGHDAKLKPQEENGLTHDWSIYVKGAQGTRFFRYSKHLKIKFDLDSIWL